MTHSLLFMQQAMPMLAFFTVYALGVAAVGYITRRLRRMRGAR